MSADIVLVVITPRIEGRTLDTFRRELHVLTAVGRQLILDFSQVDKVNTRGASAILDAANRVRAAGGNLKVVGLRASVAAFFEVLRMDTAVELQHGRAAVAKMPLAA
jgi:anti-anti-sigma regulatory factor